LGLRDDGKDLDGRFGDVIVHPHLINPEAILGPIQPAEPLDAILAQPSRLVPQVPLDSVSHPSAYVRAQASQFLDSPRSEDDLEPHLARL
jgi:hypothetical protein